MYMKKGQIAQIRDSALEIKRLATLESCGLDDETKEKIRFWVKWFDLEADKIVNALDGNVMEQYY